MPKGNVVTLRKPIAPPGTRTSYEERIARVILHGIHQEFASAVFFTREDLLHLAALQSVATISRYRELCIGVSQLIITRRLLEPRRTELCLPDHLHSYQAQGEQPYVRTFERLLNGVGTKPFSVMTLVESWRSDEHLTTNVKRVIIRQNLRRLWRAEELERDELTRAYRIVRE